MFNSKTFSLVILLYLTAGCGMPHQESSASLLSPTSRLPKVTDAQLRMIESSDPALANLGWAAISANLQMGATLSPEQVDRMNAGWETRKTNVAAKAMHSIHHSNFKDYDELVKNKVSSQTSALGNSNILKFFISDDPIEAEMASEIKKTPQMLLSNYSYQKFLSDADSAVFKPGNLAPYIIRPELAQSSVQTSPKTSLNLYPGKLNATARSVITQTGNRSDGGGYSTTVITTPLKTEINTLEELTRNEGVSNSYPIDMLTQAFNQNNSSQIVRCSTTVFDSKIQSRGFYQGNGDRTSKNISFNCISFGIADAPATQQAISNRYQLSMVGSSMIPPQGNFTNNSVSRANLDQALSWYENHPFFEATLNKATQAGAPWIGIKLSKTGSNNTDFNYLFSDLPQEIANVQCASGCLYSYPIAKSTDGTFLFALNGSGSAQFSVRAPIPFISNALERKALTINIDVLEASEFHFQDQTDTSELPNLTQALKPGDFGSFISSWATALSRSGWIMPEMNRAELQGSVTLYRLSLINEMLKSTSIQALFSTPINTPEMRMSLLATHARNQLLQLEKLFVTIRSERDLLARIQNPLKSAVLSLDRLSAEGAYSLLGMSSDALAIEKPKLITDKEELEESIMGARQMVADELSEKETSLKLLCDTFSNVKISSSEAQAAFVQQPRLGIIKACAN